MKKLSILLLVFMLICGMFCFTGCKNEEPVNYTVSIIQAENGIATVSVATAKPGDEIVVKYYPNSGYKFVTATANDAAIVGGKFIMPNKDVVVRPYFQAIDEEEIQLKVGSYVCAGVGYDGGSYTSIAEWYNIITVNDNNTIDVKAWMGGYYSTLTDVNVIREGNVFNYNMSGFNAKVYILDQNTLICQYQGEELNTIIFHYVENVDVDEIKGSYNVYIDEVSEYWNITINNDSTIKIEMKETYVAEPFYTITGNFKFYGDRVIITTTDGDTFLAIISVYESDGQTFVSIGKIGQVVPDEYDGVGQMFEKIACDYWHGLIKN